MKPFQNPTLPTSTSSIPTYLSCIASTLPLFTYTWYLIPFNLNSLVTVFFPFSAYTQNLLFLPICSPERCVRTSPASFLLNIHNQSPKNVSHNLTLVQTNFLHNPFYAFILILDNTTFIYAPTKPIYMQFTCTNLSYKLHKGHTYVCFHEK